MSDDELSDLIEEGRRRKAMSQPGVRPEVEAPARTPAEDHGERPVFKKIRERIRSNARQTTAEHELPWPANGVGDRPAASLSEPDGDSDEYRPLPVDYGRKIDRARDRLANEIEQLERQQELAAKAASLPKYSYGWFLALLELECIESAEKNSDGKTLSIRFGRVTREAGSPRSITFKEPSRFIPQSIEEFSGIRVDLAFADGLRSSLHVESFSAREFSLEGKLASSSELDGLDLGTIVEARIDVQNPSFLLKSLLERFRDLGFAEAEDVKSLLPRNMEFVFGPPGTGKTTHLAAKLLVPLMRDAAPRRVLVLAPTNKAADVLVARVIESMGADKSYTEWLVRFGSTSDERVEEAGVWRDRSFDIHGASRVVVVTTVARFSYDGFAAENAKLHELEWDLVVVDEASMIPIASIVHPLLAKKPERFVIAGDPFQIEPIVAVDEWKDENIYTLTHLDMPGSFRHPATEPHAFKVTQLDTQFRSVPAIGEVLSHFTYDGMLSHQRTDATRRTLRAKALDIKPLNLIKFPVTEHESIYRPRRLASGTPYQAYSALFSFEFTRYLAGQLEDGQPGAAPFRIGIIAPYRAQANIINKLVEAWDERPQAVSVQVGTIHGFQGDECDAIIAVLNPPPHISESPQMFLNRHNILNVAISRARDYLFILMPDDTTKNIGRLRKLSEIERLAKKQAGFVQEVEASQLERLILGSNTYLEDNTFSTGHQMVNVYRQAQRHYEVRCDDSAVDVQISVPVRAGG